MTDLLALQDKVSQLEERCSFLSLAAIEAQSIAGKHMDELLHLQLKVLKLQKENHDLKLNQATKKRRACRECLGTGKVAGSQAWFDCPKCSATMWNVYS